MTRLLVVVLMLLAAACGGDKNPVGNSSVNSMTGTWVGAVTSLTFGITGSAHATLNDNSGSITGTWSTIYADSSLNNGGTVTGSRNGNAATFTLQPSNVSICPDAVTATIQGNRMTGTYAAFNCTATDSGTIDLNR